jgi:hypothetical protein
MSKAAARAGETGIVVDCRLAYERKMLNHGGHSGH